MSTSSQHRSKARRFTVPIIVTGAVGSVLVALSMSPAFAGLTASITNSTNTAGTGALVMQEVNSAGAVTCNSTDGGSVSTNSATCSTINAYGGNLGMTAGSSSTTSVTIGDTGSIAATAFTLVPGACTQSNNGSSNGSASNLCSMFNVSITSGSTSVFSGTASALAAGGSINLLGALGTSSVTAGSSVPFTITVTLSSSSNDTDAGLAISQPFTWNFAA